MAVLPIKYDMVLQKITTQSIANSKHILEFKPVHCCILDEIAWKSIEMRIPPNNKSNSVVAFMNNTVNVKNSKTTIHIAADFL